MNQLSLNLVAITIFTFVLSSLLGPLIHLSPAVPAIAAFGLLGLATVDTLGLQGRGSAVLLDWLAGFSPEHRLRVIRHEAGHFLLAHHFDIPVTGYTLSAWEALRNGLPGYGGVNFDAGAIERAIEQGQLSAQLLDRYFIVWMAGIAAETVVYGNAEGGADDRQTLRLLWGRSQRSRQEGEQKLQWALLQAKMILQAKEPTYNALVEAMQRRAPIEECYQVLNHS